MKVFQTLQEHIFALGIQPREPNQKYSFNWRHSVGFVFFGRYAVSALSIAETFREYTDILYAVWTSALVLFNFVVILLKSGKFFKLIDNFEHTIEQRQTNPTSKRIYDKANDEIEKFTKTIYFLYTRLVVPCLVLPTAFICYFNYFTTDLENDAFRLPFPDWVPFDVKTPLGYLVASILPLIDCYYGAFVLASNSGFLYGSCLMLKSFAMDIKEEWNAMNEMGKSKENPAEFKQRVNGYIRFHATAKQFVLDFSDIYEYVITAYFLWSLLSICSCLLSLQMELQNTGISMELIKPFFLLLWAFYINFLFCNLGENVSSQFNELNDSLYQSDWYSFSIETQQMLPMLLMATQQQVVPRGFGNLLCIRRGFQKVANGGFSYFMVLRRFGG